MRYYVTADRNYDNTQIIYHFLMNKVKSEDEILLTSDHKYEYQEIVFQMARQLGRSVIINKNINTDIVFETIKLEEFEESLGLETL